jgi:hypothetical protein
MVETNDVVTNPTLIEQLSTGGIAGRAGQVAVQRDSVPLVA